MLDPVSNTYGNPGWTTLALTPDRILFLMRRNTGGTVHMYSVPADGIVVGMQGGRNIVTNLSDRGSLGIAGNVDGLTAGPDGNLYLVSFDTTGGPARNGLYRFRPGPGNTGVTEYVGTFAGNAGPEAANSLYTDTTFDPITGDLVGSGYGPGPNPHLTMYRIPRAIVLNSVGTVWPFEYLGPAWATFSTVSSQFGDGIAFDPVNGDLYLSGDRLRGPPVRPERGLRISTGPIPGSAGLGWDLDAQTALYPNSCYANCDGSTGTPLLTGNDFVCFINEYGRATPTPTATAAPAPRCSPATTSSASSTSTPPAARSGAAGL